MFLDSTYKWYHTVFIFLCLFHVVVIPSKPIHVATNGMILFFLMAQ